MEKSQEAKVNLSRGLTNPKTEPATEVSRGAEYGRRDDRRTRDNRK